MLVNKPQFDTSKIHTGQTLRASSSYWKAINNSYARDIIVLKVSPLELEGIYYNPKVESFDNDYYALNLAVVKISADSVAKNRVRLHNLVKEDITLPEEGK